MRVMNDTPPCGQVCTQSCTTPCTTYAQAERLSLGAALERCAREAVHGVWDTGRYRCPYLSWGDGPPLLFLHGLADSSQAFLLPSALLSRSFRCIAYDLPTGRGDGARLRRYSHADLVADLWDLLDHLGIRQSYVFGSSLGAAVALAALRERPERLPRAILHAPLIHKPLRWTERLFAWLMSHWPGSMAALPFRKRLLHELHRAPFAGQPPEVWDHYLAYSGAIPIRAVGRQARLLRRLDLRPLLGAIRQPVLLLAGDQDPVVRREDLEEVLRGLPGAGLFLLEGCGHFPGLTHPEMLAEVVRFFLTPPAAPEPCGKMHIADCRPV
jgi:pimeloyl-ACP methyl ester carboxylesterase